MYLLLNEISGVLLERDITPETNFPPSLPKCHYNILQANLLIRMLPSNEKKRKKNCIFKQNENKKDMKTYMLYWAVRSDWSD